jgi:hypothetical protein
VLAAHLYTAVALGRVPRAARVAAASDGRRATPAPAPSGQVGIARP